MAANNATTITSQTPNHSRSKPAACTASATGPSAILKAIDRGILAVWVEAEERHRTAATMQAQLDRGTKLPLLTKTKDGTAKAIDTADPWVLRLLAGSVESGAKRIESGIVKPPPSTPESHSAARRPASVARGYWQDTSGRR